MQMNENVLKAALFDLDGVVFDTEPQYSVFWGSQCRLYHPEHPGLENEIKGMTLTEIYDQWFSGPLLSEQPVITSRLNAFEIESAIPLGITEPMAYLPPILAGL